MSTDERKEIVDEIIAGLQAKGFVLMPAELLSTISHNVKANALLAQKKLTPYQIAKHQLIPGVTSIDTVKNMVYDGRISRKEFFVEHGKMYIVPTAIKRLRGEK